MSHSNTNMLNMKGMCQMMWITNSIYLMGTFVFIKDIHTISFYNYSCHTFELSLTVFIKRKLFKKMCMTMFHQALIASTLHLSLADELLTKLFLSVFIIVYFKNYMQKCIYCYSEWFITILSQFIDFNKIEKRNI